MNDCPVMGNVTPLHAEIKRLEQIIERLMGERGGLLTAITLLKAENDLYRKRRLWSLGGRGDDDD